MTTSTSETEAGPSTADEQVGHPGFDLRLWLDELRRLGELDEVSGAALEYEIGAITDLNAKNRGRALLFDRIPGYEDAGSVFSCSLGSPGRVASALGLPEGLDVHQLVEQLRGLPRKWREAAQHFPPRVVQAGPVCNEVLSGDQIDLRAYPAPLWHEGDGAHYLGTGGSVITRDPETNDVNYGTYRVSVRDERSLGVFIEPINHGGIHLHKYHERGERAPIAVSFGHGPLIYLASAMPLPYGVNELSVAGAIAGTPVDVIEGEVTGLPIPASSELAIEGWVEPNEEDWEGPFGEFTGYFAGGRERRPVIHVERVYSRGKPIVYGSLPGKPPFDHSFWRAALESSLLLDELRALVPDVSAAWKYETGSANFFNVVSIKQRYAGHAQQVGAAAALVAGGVSMGRYVVVVDDDVDVTDIDDVIWAMSTRTDPAHSIQIIRDTPTNPLDPMLADPEGPWVASRAIINACRPYHRLRDFAPVVEVSADLARQVRERWGGQLGWTK
ncbi:UbiD family decarboxylase [Arthrobacter sp. M4]|uniref:UbiD family decarboxylase n=1 Tax=Arthrobacter sp. M4 TaxID=218160 RepID=UPI001CDB9B56|nr:UbiD family decarboxylase [Arthrobacter sp. M4]MCA4132508.1 UbiD family decarboxylase [Arthrobacter sp. M4]